MILYKIIVEFNNLFSIYLYDNYKDFNTKLLIETIKNTNYNISLKYHFIFWISYFTFNFIRWGNYFQDYRYSLKSNLVEFPLHIIIVYFSIYYLIPNYILNKKYFKFLFLFISALALLYVIRTGLNYLLVSENIWPEAVGVHKAFSPNHIVAVILGEIYVIALASAIKLTVDWVYEKRRNDYLKKVQLRSELDFLKTQMQPHFFFNTLNNLYSLSIEKSDRAPEVILKLSEIMQYVLYDVKDSKISLLKEINYIHNYLELEKLRYGDALKSNLTIVGNLDDAEVPPLLFLPFIENCFKHGTTDGDSIKVDIHIVKKENELIFKVENNFNSNQKNESKHGIGISNVKRRLQLLYNDNFNLNTNIFANKFMVKLKIPI